MNTKSPILKNALKKHLVHFKYKRTDGTLKNVIGTTELFQVLPKSKRIELTQIDNAPREVVIYFDIQKREWTSFHADNLIEIIHIFK